MTFLVALTFAFIAFLSIIYVRRKKRLKIEFLKQIPNFLVQVSTFDAEYADILKHYVNKEKETAFSAKWRNFFINVSKYCHLKEFRDYAEIQKFLVDYKNIVKTISSSNAEIRRRESIENVIPKVAEFFEELSEMGKQYVTHLDEVRFSEKWQNIAKEVEPVDIRSTDDEYEMFASL